MMGTCNECLGKWLKKSLGQRAVAEAEGRVYEGVLRGFNFNNLRLWLLLENNGSPVVVGPIDRVRFFCQHCGEPTWNFTSITGGVGRGVQNP